MTTRTLGKQNEVTLERGTSGAARSRLATLIPSALWIAAAALILASLALPYWGMTLQAPQYPGGLTMRVFVNRMTGDADPRLDEVREIDGLNHYIGMKSLYDAAKIEQAIALPGAIAMAALLVLAAVWRRKHTWLLTVPALLFTVVFLIDLQAWMFYYGHSLDPYAPLSSAIQPFTPPVLGEGIIGQFKTLAYVDTGWILAALGGVLVLVGLIVRYAQNRAARQE